MSISNGNKSTSEPNVKHTKQVVVVMSHKSCKGPFSPVHANAKLSYSIVVHRLKRNIFLLVLQLSYCILAECGVASRKRLQTPISSICVFGYDTHQFNFSRLWYHSYAPDGIDTYEKNYYVHTNTDLWPVTCVTTVVMAWFCVLFQKSLHPEGVQGSKLFVDGLL